VVFYIHAVGSSYDYTYKNKSRAHIMELGHVSIQKCSDQILNKLKLGKSGHKIFDILAPDGPFEHRLLLHLKRHSPSQKTLKQIYIINICIYIYINASDSMIFFT
jgi:hypothetical protein